MNQPTPQTVFNAAQASRMSRKKREAAAKDAEAAKVAAPIIAAVLEKLAPVIEDMRKMAAAFGELQTEAQVKPPKPGK